MDLLTYPYVIYAVGAALVLIAVMLVVSALSSNCYEPRSHLLTKAEQHFYKYLKQAVNEKTQIFCCVRVADVVDIKQSVKGRKRMQRLGQIAQKHFDYVLTDMDTRILCAIELNDSSHEQKERKERDEFLDEVMKIAGVPLIKIKTGKIYDVAMIQRQLNQAFPGYFG